MPLYDLKTDIAAYTEEIFVDEYNLRTTPELVDEFHIVPSASPYRIRLREIPAQETKVQVPGYVEVTSMPNASSEFLVDYNKGYVYFYSSVAKEVVRTIYFGTGSLIDAEDVNLIIKYLTRATQITELFYPAAQDEPDRTISIKKGVIWTAGCSPVIFWGNQKVDMGPGGAYQASQLTVGYYNKIAFSLFVPQVAPPEIPVVTLVSHEGTQAATPEGVTLPVVPVGNIPDCFVLVRDDGTAGPGTILPINQADITDIRPFFATAVLDHNALIGRLSSIAHTQYLLKAGDQITGDVTVADGKKIDGRDVSVDGVTVDSVKTQSAFLSRVKEVHGPGSGISADLLDGKEGAYYEKIAGGKRLLTIYMEGEAFDEETFFNGLTFDEEVAIDRITLWARTQPTGADMTIDILKDSTEQARIGVLGAGTSYRSTTITPIIFYIGDVFGLKMKSVGSIQKGGQVTVILHYTSIKMDFVDMKVFISAGS